MTKVILSPSILDYRHAMAELVDQVCEENAVADADREDIEELYPMRKDIPELWTPGQLYPPQVESLWPDLWLEDGRLDGIIQINTSEYFGVVNLYVSLEDERGTRLESGYALGNEEMKNHWGYFVSAPAQHGMTVVVRAVALDALGAAGIKTERVTIRHKAEQWAEEC